MILNAELLAVMTVYTIALAATVNPLAADFSPQCSESCHEKSPVQCSEMSPDTCPPGMFCNDTHCECGVYPDRFISCNGSSTMILRSFCVSFNSSKNLTLVGNCIRKLSRSSSSVDFASDTLYHALPKSVHKLNDMICKPLNKTGTLCGRCLPDHYPLAYSFNMTCIPCPHARWNWFRYIMAAYVPLTVFYVIVIFFKLNVTSSHFFAVVYYCQAVSMPLLMRNLFLAVDADGFPSFAIIAKSVFSLYGIWNLDFFKPFYSDLCLGLDVLPTLALDYAIAVYPLLLIFTTYQLIALYDKNNRVILIMWRPFQVLFSFFRRKWDIRTSVVDAFATFIFLSNIKFLCVSFDLLIPTQIFKLYPDHYNYTYGLLYAGHVDYFGREHLPYALLAIAVLCVFVILPTVILAFHPFGFFHKLLNLFPFRWHVLHTFVDSFQGCYKNGTQAGTRDYRWFASLYFVSRIVYFILYSISDKIVFSCFGMMIQILHITLLSTLLPFKNFNAINIILMQLLALMGLTVLVISFALFLAPQYMQVLYVLATVFGCVPLLYVTATTSYLLFRCLRATFKVSHGDMDNQAQDTKSKT